MRWRVHDIPADLRKVARDAAKAEDLTLGRWLDRAILQSARSSAGETTAGGPASVTPATDDPIAQDRTTAENRPIEDDRSAQDPMVADERFADDASVERAAAPLPAAPGERETPEHGLATASMSDADARASGGVAQPLPAAVRAIALVRTNKRVRMGVAAALLIGLVGTVALWRLSSTPGTPQVSSTGSPSTSAAPPPAAGSPQGSRSSFSAPSVPPAQDAAPQSLADIIDGLRRDAENGDAMAQHDLALAYVNGRGVPQNYQIAAEWFAKAAAAGLERAQFNLAVLYENALGVPEDLTRAFTLYSAAAEQGFAPAQHNLAVAYAQGRGTSRDYQAATLWFRRAAEQGVASAQYNLGMIYERGLAGPPDEQTAYGWYRRAAASGSEAAVARLAAIEGRIATAPAQTKPGPRATKLSAGEIAEIQRLLSQLSFSPGAPDGKPGKATREAIRQYQQVAGLPVDGEPSQALLTHLRQVTTMMRSGGR